MAYKNEAKHVMLNALKQAITHVSLHSAYPATSSNEISGGGYARQEVTFTNPSGGAIQFSNQPQFSVSKGATIAAVGFWSAATAGTLYADAQVDTETYANPGTYTLESGSLDLNK